MSNMRIPSSALPIDYFSPWVIVTALFLSKSFTPHTRTLLAPRRKARQVRKGKMDNFTTHLFLFFRPLRPWRLCARYSEFRLRIRRSSMSFVHRLRPGSRRVFIRVDPNIDNRALAASYAFAGLFQRRTNLTGLADGNSPAAETFGEFFEIDVAELVADAATLRTVLADLAAADLVHRRVVADDGDIRQSEALRRFHVPRSHAEGTVAVIAQHFFLRMHELGRHRERRADTESAQRPRIHPVAGFARLHGRRRDRYDIAAVADVDSVLGQEIVDLVSDSIRIDRRGLRLK